MNTIRRMYNCQGDLYYYHPDGMEGLYAPVDSNGEFFDDYKVYYFRKDIKFNAVYTTEITKEKDFLIGFIGNAAVIFRSDGVKLCKWNFLGEVIDFIRLIQDYQYYNICFGV